MSSLKKNAAVKFRTRKDRPLMHGKVVNQYDTPKGAFVTIKGDDGAERRVRPCNVQPA